MTFYTLLLVVIGALQAILFWWQLRLFRSSLTDTKLAATAAERSAKTAEMSVHIMQDVAQRELRAYVAASPGPIENLKLGQSPVVRINIKNHGKTPAKNLRNDLWSNLLPYPLPAEFEFPKPSPSTPPVSSTVQPDQQVVATVRYGGVLDTATKAVIESGTDKRIYDYGVVRYEDVFGQLHTTRYCFVRGGPGLADNISEVCEQHNETD